MLSWLWSVVCKLLVSGTFRTRILYRSCTQILYRVLTLVNAFGQNPLKAGSTLLFKFEHVNRQVHSADSVITSPPYTGARACAACPRVRFMNQRMFPAYVNEVTYHTADVVSYERFASEFREWKCCVIQNNGHTKFLLFQVMGTHYSKTLCQFEGLLQMGWTNYEPRENHSARVDEHMLITQPSFIVCFFMHRWRPNKTHY